MKLLPLILSSLFITTLAQARERPLARRNTPSKRVTRQKHDFHPESNPAPLKQDTSPAPSASDIWDIFQRVNPPPPSFVQNPLYDPQQKQSPHQAQNWYNPLAAIAKRQASTDPTTDHVPMARVVVPTVSVVMVRSTAETVLEPNAAAGEESCALNVCCSKFGFCGSTDEFCVDECADDPSGHCGKVSVPTNAGASVLSRVIGYYESWAATRPCSAWFPQNVPADGYTHLNFAFAGIDPDSSQIVPGDTNDPSYYSSFTGLKKINLNLKTYISVGGWAFNDPPTQRVFSTVAGDVGKSQTFANSAVAFMIQYGFDGVDIGLTFTAPSSYWYLQHFDLQNLLKYADWINLMSYDLHGTWDAKDAYIGNIVGAHTNLTEIDQSLQLFMRAGVPLNKIVLGLGFYGRSFELSDANCAAPGCPYENLFSKIGHASYLFSVSTVPRLQDHVPQQLVSCLGINVNQWVSYDDADTFKQKIDYANGGGLGGVMVWAADQDDFAGSALSAILGQPVGTAIPAPDGFGSNDAQSCTVMDCGVACPSGFVQPILTVAAKPEVVRFVAQQEINLKTVNGAAQVCQVGEISLAGDSFLLQIWYAVDHILLLESALTLAYSGLTDAQLEMGQSYWGDWKQKWYDIFGTGACPGNAVTAPFTLDELFDNPPEDEDMSYKLQTETINDDNPDAGSGE
ncbi:hypothetical protein PHLCEN_2v13424 [Hermanssonia centrifuga]|uniref:Uncharacterized protein n=1 Tax=Hermanssonia centrifuga TaxID=98765 RepID=A0A2R6NE93_9APHY|nr:hypothetical protein PHLCEN_2v13424 [Hermanssonia centrifuga]